MMLCYLRDMSCDQAERHLVNRQTELSRFHSSHIIVCTAQYTMV